LPVAQRHAAGKRKDSQFAMVHSTRKPSKGAIFFLANVQQIIMETILDGAG
jgi:hypothetical protein